MFTLSNKLISIGKISLITLVLILTISYLYILYNFKDIKDIHYSCKSSAQWQKETLEDKWIYSK